MQMSFKIHKVETGKIGARSRSVSYCDSDNDHHMFFRASDTVIE